ncbi:MAG: sulfurtransferase [Chloroflexi bacterium]|nr:sulfurtransferase [Chloroflexota bacterium]
MAQGYARPELLADTEWLAHHLDDSNIRIVDCDVPDSYRRAHIPGAVNPQDNFFKNPDDRRYVMTPEQFATTMEGLGIGDDTLVVAYDAHGSHYATRLWWCLRYYRHQRVKVLNGGWQKWLSEGRPITFKVPQTPKAKFTPQPSPSVLASLDDVKAALGRQDTVMLDVRSKGEWTGENTRGNRRGGHLPGAVHLEWLNYVTDDDQKTIKSAEELRSMFQQAGVTPNKEVIAH